MEALYPALILLSGFILDLIIGDPDYKYHPVRIIGKCIDLLLEKLKGVFACKKLEGIVLTVLTVFFAVSVYSALYLLFNGNNSIAGFLVNVFFVYSMIALKDLFKHCTPVIDALANKDTENARRATGMIVGRDVNYLDEAGIIRAAIETLAENFVDGFLSPVFWYGAGCLIGLVINVNPVYSGIVFLIVFKVASTLDSMVGYKTEEYKDLGWAGARLDDVMNFIPARLSLIILYAGAALTDLDPKSGMKVALSDRLKHDSPNSAHSESFVAGALKARLGGPTRYRDGIKDKPWLGEEYPDPSLPDIKRVMRLLLFSAWVAVSVIVIVLLCQF
jgi:adenosylcobinamide-phosphate synthase